MKKTMKRMASLTLGLCMAFTIVTPVNAAVKGNQSSKKINGYVLTTRMALEEEYTIYVADPANVGHAKKKAIKEAKWATQAEYKGPKDNGKLTTTWMFSSPDGSVKWEAEGNSGTGKITGGSKTRKADVVTVKGTLCGTSLKNVTMTSKASFKKGNIEYFVSCKK